MYVFQEQCRGKRDFEETGKDERGGCKVQILQNTFEELWNACIKATFGVEMVAHYRIVIFVISFFCIYINISFLACLCSHI